MGRPTTYKGNKLTWNSNGELLTYKDGSGTINYTYDINSIRTKKVVNGKTHNYVVNGTQILQEKIVEGTSTTIINYHYVLNKLVGFTYNKDGETSNYIYRRNIQGDIIGIYDSLGNEVGEYAYDAYGKCYVKYKDNSSEEEKTILNTNPFRYRGYYYDNETGLYYLNARYYDPSIGRFISPDVLTILDETKGHINGLNLYMYCNNNPVMFVDPSGCLPRWLRDILDIAAYVVAGIIGLVAGIGIAVLTGNFMLGLVTAIAVFGVVNNIINAIYYNYISDGVSDLSEESYSNGYRSGYINRWDRLDYTKSQTKEKNYNSKAWMYYSEYSLHMYAWLLTGFAYEKNIPILSEIAASAITADIEIGEADNRFFVRLFTYLIGALGI